MNKRVIVLLVAVLVLAMVAGPVAARCTDARYGGPVRVEAEPTARPLPGTATFGQVIQFETRPPGE